MGTFLTRVFNGFAKRREQIFALRYLPSFLKLVWQTNSLYATTMIIFRLLRCLFPIAILFTGKLIVDALVLRMKTGEQTRIWPLILLEFLLVITGEIFSRLSALVESLLGDLLSSKISLRLMEHASKLDLAHFENPSFYDKLERARQHSTSRIGLLGHLLSIGQDLLTLSSLSIVLLFYSPWLLLLLTVAIVPGFFSETYFASLEYSMLFRWTPRQRQLEYLRYVGSSDKTVKEVQTFGLAPWLIDHFQKLSKSFFDENKQFAVRRSIMAIFFSIIGAIGYYSAYAYIILQAMAGVLSLGSLTFLSVSFLRSRDMIHNLMNSGREIYRHSLYLKDLFDFFETSPTMVRSASSITVSDPIVEGFVFENVGFRYPGSDRWAVRNVNLCLRPGERVALVGENGSGKTTITKLIARLYDPTEGRILLDGRDLRHYDPESLRSSIGIVFQDYVRYDMTLNENIGVGDIELTRDYLEKERNSKEKNSSPPSTFIKAAEKSMANSLLARLPGGYRQMLGRRFEGGIELSGGEWQKIALSRAYLRKAQLLILDEPTASLDARAEYEVFCRFSDMAMARMAIIISHRFSTVRIADRIIVLKQGTVIEDGTHNELLDANGLYAELFALQAEGYRTTKAQRSF